MCQLQQQQDSAHAINKLDVLLMNGLRCAS